MVKPKRLLILFSLLVTSLSANAFCGFYVARADQTLYNDASQVVLVRDEDRTVVTMNNNFRGDVNEFAIVIPVPTVLEEGQINVAERSLIEHIDAYTAPRLVEYFDADPCQIMRRFDMMEGAEMEAPAAAMADSEMRAKSLGVTIEAEYAVGEYDILILSAKQSDGLVTWLQESGYKVPDGALSTVRSYLKQGMKFFVAKVNLETQAKLGYTYLRPIQLAYESAKFMLPIRLGMVNADGPQEMYVYALSRAGRIETRNYRSVKMPTGMELPERVKDDFGNFYKAMFTRQLAANNNNVGLLEYAWDMAWCDPCAADPLSADQLRKLGVFWVDPKAKTQRGANVFVTRLHFRYDNEHFPEDLMFVQTGDRENFQGRYVIRHPWDGSATCDAAKQYLNVDLPKRQAIEARTLANLTGWPLSSTQNSPIKPPKKERPWWQQLWNKEET